MRPNNTTGGTRHRRQYCNRSLRRLGTNHTLQYTSVAVPSSPVIASLCTHRRFLRLRPRHAHTIHSISSAHRIDDVRRWTSPRSHRLAGPPDFWIWDCLPSPNPCPTRILGVPNFQKHPACTTARPRSHTRAWTRCIHSLQAHQRGLTLLMRTSKIHSPCPCSERISMEQARLTLVSTLTGSALTTNTRLSLSTRSTLESKCILHNCRTISDRLDRSFDLSEVAVRHQPYCSAKASDSIES